MKASYRIVLVTIWVCISISTSAVPQSNNDSLIKSASAWQKSGEKHYGKREGSEAIADFTRAHDTYLLVLDFKRAATCLHSIAFTYDEILHDNGKALSYAEKSLPLHYETNDTLELGNMYKYIGMLKGRMGKYAEAKADVRKALGYFQTQEYTQGVAVSQFDMGLIYVSEQRSDSALYYILLSKDYWKSEGNKGRVFGINNHLYRIYADNKQYRQAQVLLQENEQLLLLKEIYYTEKLAHYNNALSYYSSMKDEAGIMKYTYRQTQLKDSLAAQGMKME